MKGYCFIYLIINALAYTIFLFYYNKRKRTFDIGSIILIAWNIGSWGAVYYYTFPVTYASYPKIAIFPLLILFIANVILFRPFLKTNYDTFIRVNCGGMGKLLRSIAIFFSIIGIPAFINVIFKLSSFSLVGSALAEMYSGDEDKTLIIFSPYIRPFYSILRHFVPFIIFLFFYILTKIKGNVLLVIGLFLVVATFFIVSLLSGSRGGILSLLITCIFYSFFMRNMFEKRIFRIIKGVGVIVGVLIGFGIAAISISRLTDMSESSGRNLLMDQWISQYAGEGIIRYDNTIWHISSHLNGRQNLPYPYSFLDKSTKDLNKVAKMGESKLKTPITVFYTYFGDLIIDFGIIGAIIAVTILSYFIKKLLLNKKNEISFYRLIILNYFFSYITLGFTANLYRTYYTQIQIIYICFVLAILYLIQTYGSKHLRPCHRDSCL